MYWVSYMKLIRFQSLCAAVFVLNTIVIFLQLWRKGKKCFVFQEFWKDVHLNKVLWKLNKLESAHLIIRAGSYHNSGAH